MQSISSIMTTDVVTVTKDTAIIEAMELLTRYNITGLPVVNEKNKILGIVSEKDLMELTYNLSNKTYDSRTTPQTVEDVMTADVSVADINDSVSDVCMCLMEGDFRRVPVVSNGKMVGIISRKDLILLNATAMLRI